jgi:hypothetical protein
LKAILRSAVLAASVAAGLTMSMAPAHAVAPEAIVFTGTAHINCFGCGSSTGSAKLALAGTRTDAMATASYTVQEDPGVSCVITGSADGTVTSTSIGATVSFHWLRVGAVAVITTGGAITGAAVAGFAVTSPALPSVPCGGPVDADVAGVLVGASGI